MNINMELYSFWIVHSIYGLKHLIYCRYNHFQKYQQQKDANLIRIRYPHLLPIVYWLSTSLRFGKLKMLLWGGVMGQHEYIRCLSGVLQNAYVCPI
jgi:hypothetical protein